MKTPRASCGGSLRTGTSTFMRLVGEWAGQTGLQVKGHLFLCSRSCWSARVPSENERSFKTKGKRLMSAREFELLRAVTRTRTWRFLGRKVWSSHTEALPWFCSSSLRGAGTQVGRHACWGLYQGPLKLVVTCSFWEPTEPGQNHLVLEQTVKLLFVRCLINNWIKFNLLIW